MFDEKKIESLCTRDMTFLLGQQLQLLHAVENLQVEEAETPEAFYINAEVGSKAGGGERFIRSGSAAAGRPGRLRTSAVNVPLFRMNRVCADTVWQRRLHIWNRRKVQRG
mgnify:CR=1 FL=1